MNSRGSITQQQFDTLLSWLDPDRDKAGEKYEAIRRGLIKTFTARGIVAAEAEELVDETINRVSRKVKDIAETYVGDPALYFYAVSRNVHREFLRHRVASALPPPVQLLASHQDESQQQYECLESCLKLLAPEQRRLVISYYSQPASSKLRYKKREKLASQLGITPNALTVRIHRLRTQLHRCVTQCMERKALLP